MWWLWEQLLALEPTSQLGGIYANKSGYHNTRAANAKSWPGNYSIRDPEDKGGPADKAAAIDWSFPEAWSGDYTRIVKYSQRLMKSSVDPDDPRLDGWREWYGQADADSQVEGYDTRHLYPVSSDPSHLRHIHASEDRDKVEDYANKRAFLSVVKGESTQQWREAEMATDMTHKPSNGNGYTVGELIAGTNAAVWEQLAELRVIKENGEKALAEARETNRLLRLMALEEDTP